MARKSPEGVADAVERWPIGKLIASSRNARTHSAEQIKQLRGAFRDYGQVWPLLVREDGTIIAGHGRLEAAKAEGLDTVRVIVARGWTEDRCRAFALLDNRVPLNAGWDDELLRLELSDLSAGGINLAELGFKSDELVNLLPVSMRDPDAVVEPVAQTVSKLGDLWLLGKHRLLCGDSTDKADVARLCDDQPNLMVTDPPYGVMYDANWRVDRGLSDDAATGAVNNDHRDNWTDAWKLFRGGVVYCWHGGKGKHASIVQASLETAGFETVNQIIWAKARFPIGRGDYHWQHEACWYAVRKGAKHHWNGGRSQTTLWSISHVTSDTGHSTQKPVECMRRPMINNTRPEEVVYDPFVGSGTTIIAAASCDRRALTMEINPRFVDIAVRRWQQFTGQTATLEGGKTFDAVAKLRKKNGRH